MIRELVRMGDERLLRIAKPVPASMIGSQELDALVADMFETMEQAGGVGLAAPQIGVDLQLFVMGFDSSERYPDAPAVPQTVVINPVITPLSQEMEEGWEGCLSIPGLRGVVDRYARIRYKAVDARGETIDRIAEGFHARVVQHEYDHLIGRLYPSRITDFSRFGFTDVLFPETSPAAQR
ncbi:MULTISPECIES: peptide deformylase [Pseudomonas]|uniref:Peptide deformylase n=1 Tax=Pseudomonas luteola TaxID=47886 RepID=A0A2X2D1B1_PSELU|nr:MULTISPECIES: peptide deformylase [Pseudomonas]ENA29655.1 peptide deformylase 2 [Pseudomonas sp. HPB0071]MBF8640629.1 peptide deformylase [Pseudomonas zeshuii]RRW49548.1 peptide deformylase [Pseudomonas luteola]SHI73810.1 peptide deformylase [Pseudomonas zeshuii]SPZ05985.1 peptide deformylase [Pseudomonas luteola]